MHVLWRRFWRGLIPVEKYIEQSQVMITALSETPKSGLLNARAYIQHSYHMHRKDCSTKVTASLCFECTQTYKIAVCIAHMCRFCTYICASVVHVQVCICMITSCMYVNLTILLREQDYSTKSTSTRCAGVCAGCFEPRAVQRCTHAAHAFIQCVHE
jgi:hypothetical protein